MGETDRNSHGREWDSQAYHRVAEPQLSWGLRLLEKIPLRGDETVLDAGCGSGKLTAELLKRLPNGRVVAVDVSANMLKTARWFLEPQFGDRVTYLLSDLSALAIESEVDMVFSAATFHWVGERGRMFQRLHAALKPGGWLVAQAGGGKTLSDFWRSAEAVITRSPYAEHLRGFKRQQDYLDPDLTTEQMRAAGFRDVDVELHEAPVEFPTPEAFVDFIRTVNMKNYVERLPAELGTRFLQEILGQSMRSGRPLTLDYQRINMRGRRSAR